MPTSSGFILQQVVDLIEPLTRFDRSSVQLLGDSQQTLACTGVWTSDVRFTSSTSDGTGKLPSGVRDAASQAGMEQAIGEFLARERSSVTERVGNWCDEQAGLAVSGHRPLSAKDCSSGVARIGYAWGCGKCSGRGKVSCDTCHGLCKVTCKACGGAGHTDCSNCGAKGKKTCSHCNGQRIIYRQVPKQVYNSVTNQTSTVYETVWEHCMQCQGGEVICHSCSGQGKRNCFSCSTLGKVTCPDCLGTGDQKCKPCSGTGWLHRVSQTACEVSNSFSLASPEADEESGDTIAQWDFSAFCKMASVRTERPQIGASRLVRAYPGTLQLCRAKIRCAGQDFLLYGYGPRAQVFHFKDIVGHLLTNDLEQLKSSLADRWGFLPFRDHAALHSSLCAMLESELNQQLCDKGQRQALVANRTVSEEHARSTVSMLRKAMGRLYLGKAALGVSALVAVALITLQALYYYGYMLPENRAAAFGIFAAVVVATAVGTEFFCRNQLLKGFSRHGGNESRQAAARLLQATGVLRRWRIAASAATIAAAAGFFALVTS